MSISKEKLLVEAQSLLIKWFKYAKSDENFLKDPKINAQFKKYNTLFSVVKKELKENNKANSFQIFLKGIDDKTMTVDIVSTDLISDVLDIASKRLNISSDEIRMDFGGKPLRPNLSLSDYNIQKENTLHLNLRLLGGMFKDGKSERVQTFANDIGLNKWNKIPKKLQTALTKLLTAAKKSRMTIDYKWLVKQVKNLNKINESTINGLRKNIENEIAMAKDLDLSGSKGHEFSRHVNISKEEQEKRLKENPNLPQVTRVNMKKGNAIKYESYCTALSKEVPSVIKEHVEKIVYDTLIFISSEYYTNAYTTAKTRKKAILKEVFEDDLNTVEIIDDLCIIELKWSLKLTNGNIIHLTCAPEIESMNSFSKIITLRDKDNKDKFIEKNEHEPVNMFWGSNKLIIKDIKSDSKKEELKKKLDSLNFKLLGVTQF